MSTPANDNRSDGKAEGFAPPNEEDRVDFDCPIPPHRPARQRASEPAAREQGGWRPGATWRGQAPVPPSEQRRRQRKRRLGSSRGAGALARFFTKQVLWFVLLAFVLLVVDVFLYILIATHEMDRSYQYGTPATLTRTVSEQLVAADGAYALGAEAQNLLDEQGAWAQLVAADGSVTWSYAVPKQTEEASATPAAGEGDPAGDASAADAGDPASETASSVEASDPAESTASAIDASEPAESTVSAANASEPAWGVVPAAYSLNDIALIGHYHALNGFPTFLWDRDDGLLLVGFPPGSYETAAITWPAETWQAIPGYIASVLLLDLLILFVAYLVYRRRTQRAVEPINDALDALSHGGRAQLDLKGDLQPIADQINETSDVLESKDRAREQWIRGVSHDIRTPLSMIIVRADGIAAAPDAPADAQAQARAIRTQGLKIKGLVADLNAASQLAFDPQPLNLARISLPRMLREIAAAYLNSGLDASHPLDFKIEDACAEAMVLGDARLLDRLVENLLGNARLHNPEGCSIELSLAPAGKAGYAVLRVADDGTGIAPEALEALRRRLGEARAHPADVAPNDAGHGLGLVLVDRIARAHGGSLEVTGGLGTGFAATVELPLA